MIWLCRRIVSKSIYMNLNRTTRSLHFDTSIDDGKAKNYFVFKITFASGKRLRMRSTEPTKDLFMSQLKNAKKKVFVCICDVFLSPRKGKQKILRNLFVYASIFVLSLLPFVLLLLSVERERRKEKRKQLNVAQACNDKSTSEIEGREKDMRHTQDLFYVNVSAHECRSKNTTNQVFLVFGNYLRRRCCCHWAEWKAGKKRRRKQKNYEEFGRA